MLSRRVTFMATRRLSQPMLKQQHLRWVSNFPDMTYAEMQETAREGVEKLMAGQENRRQRSAYTDDYESVEFYPMMKKQLNKRDEWRRAQTDGIVLEKKTHATGPVLQRMRNTFIIEKYKKVFEESSIVVIMQPNVPKAKIEKMSINLAKAGIGFKGVVQNTYARVALEQSENPKLREFANLLNGPICLAHVKCEDADLIENLRTIFTCDKKSKTMFFYGAKVQDSILDHEDIAALTKIDSTVALRSQLIQTIASPVHNLIRTLSYPQNNLVKTLDFKVKQSASDESSPQSA